MPHGSIGQHGGHAIAHRGSATRKRLQAASAKAVKHVLYTFSRCEWHPTASVEHLRPGMSRVLALPGLPLFET